jgi:N12 class adenine-specific DNA methylase
VRDFGPINTTVSISEDEETGEVRETHRRPNLQPFLDDPDCWLVASIEDYDLETDTARPGPIFTERVIAPPAPPVITSPPMRSPWCSTSAAMSISTTSPSCCTAIRRCHRRTRQRHLPRPADGSWQTADAYLSGQVRDKLKAAEAAAALDPAYERNVTALQGVQPADLGPPTSPRVSAHPWIPAADVVAFVKETMGADIRSTTCRNWRRGRSRRASSAISPPAHRNGAPIAGMPASCSPMRSTAACRRSSTPSRTATASGACSMSSIPRRPRRSCRRSRTAFQRWIWSDPDRTDRLARVYNDRFNNIAPRAFDGSHLQLPGASGAFSLYGHQKRGIWRIISAGSTYLAHAVGAGKTMTMAAAIMEQRRLGLIAKAMLVVPGHCLAQAAREFLALYPNARILVADETNFTKDKRHRFLSRAATATWDAIIITHSAFRFIGVPSAFEQQMIQDELELYETLLTKVESDDRVSRKRLER